MVTVSLINCNLISILYRGCCFGNCLRLKTNNKKDVIRNEENTRSLHTLMHSLDDCEIESLMLLMGTPSGIRERIKRNKKEYLPIMKFHWSGFNVNNLIEALETIERRDLSRKAESIPWLYTSSPLGVGEGTETVKSFVNMLREEMLIGDWIFILNSELRVDIFPKFEEIFSLCVDGGIFTTDLRYLCQLLTVMLRLDLVRKMQDYKPLFQEKSNRQLIAELKKEIRNFKKMKGVIYL